MNSVLNHDSEQCIESKLSRVYSAHTLTQPARALHPGRSHSTSWVLRRGRVVACRVSYHGHVAGLPCRVAASTRALARLVATLLPLPLVTIQKIVSRLSPCRASTTRRVVDAAARVAVPLRRVVGRWVLYRSLYRCPYCDTKAAPSHDTNHCIATYP